MAARQCGRSAPLASSAEETVFYIMNLWFKLHSSPSQDRVSPQANAHVHRSRERGTQPGGRSPTAGGERGPGLTGASATEGHAHLGAGPPACRATPLWESRGGSSATEGHAPLGAGPLLQRATPLWGRVLCYGGPRPSGGGSSLLTHQLQQQDGGQPVGGPGTTQLSVRGE